MRLTISDIAKAAGVSTATVSNVLNKRGRVGRSTQRVVLSTVKRLGYMPNPHARRLAATDTRTLGVIVSDIDNPFFTEVIKGFLARTRELGYEAILSETNYDPERTREAAHRMMAHDVNGVAILACEMSARLVKEVAKRKIAVTFLDHAPAGRYISTLRIDYESGIRQTIDHLVGLGHRQIAFVAGRPDLNSHLLRLEAYKMVMRERGLSPGPLMDGHLNFPRAVEAGVAIAKMSEKRPTAVMAVNDLTAMGVINGLHSAGLRVPADISVAGFGHTRLSEYSNPTITTVNVQRDLLGQMAADIVHDLRRASDPRGQAYEISAALVVGRSTGAVAST